MSPRKRIIPVFIPHAGCEHDCVFCNQRWITGAVGEERGEGREESCDVGSQVAEMAYYGGSFTAIPVERQNELLESAQPFLSINPHNSIRVSTRPDCIDESTLERLKGYGVATVELGAQSMCDDVLALSGRGHTAYDVEHAAGLVISSGLSLILQMMTGLPGDTREKSIFTARRFIELGPAGVRIYPTVVVRGTRLHELWERGEYQEHTVEDAVVLCAELYELFKEAGIPIIRLGLNPSEALSAGGAVAGAYHPAFGELVYSRVYYNRAVALLGGVAPGSAVTLVVARGCVSMMIGQHRCNIVALTEGFSLSSIKVIESDLDPGELVRVRYSII